jgi:adenylate cyclase
MGLEGEADQARVDDISIWNQLLKSYRSQQWDVAELQLLNLRKRDPEMALYEIYLERIAIFRKEPPGDGWDGVWKFETK